MYKKIYTGGGEKSAEKKEGESLVLNSMNAQDLRLPSILFPSHSFFFSMRNTIEPKSLMITNDQNLDCTFRQKDSFLFLADVYYVTCMYFGSLRLSNNGDLFFPRKMQNRQTQRVMFMFMPDRSFYNF